MVDREESAGERRESIGGCRWEEEHLRILIRGTGSRVIPVAITGFDSPEVRIAELSGTTPRQRALRAQWLAGTP